MKAESLRHVRCGQSWTDLMVLKNRGSSYLFVGLTASLNDKRTEWQQPCSKPCCECAKDGHWQASISNLTTGQVAQHHLHHLPCPLSHRIMHLLRISINHRPICPRLPIHQCQIPCIQLQSSNPRWDLWLWLIRSHDRNPLQSRGHITEARMGICARRSCERSLIVWLKSPLLHRKKHARNLVYTIAKQVMYQPPLEYLRVCYASKVQECAVQSRKESCADELVYTTLCSY